jgi:hypothetical protein
MRMSNGPDTRWRNGLDTNRHAAKIVRDFCLGGFLVTKLLICFHKYSSAAKGDTVNIGKSYRKLDFFVVLGD